MMKFKSGLFFFWIKEIMFLYEIHGRKLYIKKIANKFHGLKMLFQKIVLFLLIGK